MNITVSRVMRQYFRIVAEETDMDLRTERTKKEIREAFLKLRVKKPIEKITIREIAELAMINKATFYRHYEDIYQLSDEIENEVLDQCIVSSEAFNMQEINQRFTDNRELFQTVFSGSRGVVAVNKLHDRYMKIFLASHPELNNNLEKKVILSSMIFGNFKTYTYYQNEDLSAVIKGMQTLTDVLNYIVF